MPEIKLLPNDQRDAFIQNKITSEMMKRSIHSVPLHIERAEGDPATKETLLSFSSEAYIEEYCGWEIGYAYVRLLHKPENMRLDRAKRGLSHLMNHQRDEFLGKLVDPQIMDKGEGNKLYFRAIPSNQDEAKQVWMDIEAGILDQTSLGFNVYALQLVRMEGEKAYYDAVDWEPMEGSTVTVQADLTVGFGRSIKTEEKNDESKTPEQEKRKMEQEIVAAQDAEKLEASRIAGIRAAQKNFPSIVTPEDALEAIASRQTVEQFNNVILDRQVKGQRAATPASEIAMSEKEQKSYSILRAFGGIMDKKFGGFEKEISDEIASRLGRSARADNSFFMPSNLKVAGQRTASALTKDGGGSTGGYIVPEVYDGANFIELLRNMSLTEKLGITRLRNLKGDYKVPVQASAGNFSWITEDSEATESNLTLGLKTMSMKTGSSSTSYSRDLRINSDPSIEQMVLMDLAEIAALGLDAATFHGLGSAGQPQGLFNTSGVGATTVTSFAFASALAFKSDVKVANAFKGNLAYVTDPASAVLLEGKEKASSTGIFLLEDGKMAGFPVFDSNQITAGYMAFGDWSQMVVADWGGVEIMVDPYSASKQGKVIVTVFVTMDTLVRQLGAFSIGSGLTV